jgi:hypothetical protein
MALIGSPSYFAVTVTGLSVSRCPLHLAAEYPIRPSGRVGEAAPIGTELERHDDAGDHAHPERDRETLIQNVEADISLASGRKPERFQYGDERGQPTVKAGRRMCQASTQEN